MQKKDFLVEIGCEELPASSLIAVATAFQSAIEVELTRLELAYEKSELFFTPRRIAVRINQLSAEQPPRSFEKQGPNVAAAFGKDGMPTLACLGFVKSCRSSLEKLIKRDTPKGSYIYCEVSSPAVSTETLLLDVVKKALSNLPIPKPMRWADKDFSFLRPVHWIVLLFGDDIVPGVLFDKTSDRFTYGHRFMKPQGTALKNPAEYEKKLEDVFVIADFSKRRAHIQQQISLLSLPAGAKVLVDDALLEHVTLLVEWPRVLLGKFKESFLSVPAEALMTSMKSHQKCFPVQNANQQLLPYFVITSNIDSRNASRVIAGNERVIHARLSDAAFFYQKDLKTSLEERFKNLDSIIFQQGLGSVAEKSQRIGKLAGFIIETLHGDAAVLAETLRAAKLCKCDLLTEMVGEFPELQGTMGEYYARHGNESAGVAAAISEHYLPRFSGDILPESKIGMALALADRLDSLVGMFGINKKPTGDKDPLGLRRAALGIIRILLEKNLDLDVLALLKKAKTHFKNLPNKEAAEQTYAFLMDRLKAYYQDKENISAEVFQSVVALSTTSLIDLDKRLKAMQAFTLRPEAQSLAAASKRVLNILKKEDAAHTKKVNPKCFEHDAEKNLYHALAEKTEKINAFFSKKNYEAVLLEIASLKTVVDAFFLNVMILVDDEKLRNNRIALLQMLRDLFLKVADISLISTL